MNVIIDGIKYVPAKEIIISRAKIARYMLYAEFGKKEIDAMSADELENLIADESICVYVGDEHGDYPLRCFLDDLAIKYFDFK